MKEIFEEVEKWINDNKEFVQKVKKDDSWNSPLEDYKHQLSILPNFQH